MRVASLGDTLSGTIKAWSEAGRRPSKRLDLADITRLVEAHAELWDALTPELKRQVKQPT